MSTYLHLRLSVFVLLLATLTIIKLHKITVSRIIIMNHPTAVNIQRLKFHYKLLLCGIFAINRCNAETSYVSFKLGTIVNLSM